MMCIFCTGPQHAQAAMKDPSFCKHCIDMPEKVRARRLNVAVGNNRGPNAGVVPKPVWSDEVDVEAYPYEDLNFHSYLPTREDGYLPVTDNPPSQGEEEECTMECEPGVDPWALDSDDEGYPAPLLSPRPPSTSDQTGPADANLFEVCKRAATKLALPWPTPQDTEGTERDLYDGRRLPPTPVHTKQLLPAVPDCMREVRKYWDAPFRSKLPTRGYTTLEVGDMKELGLSGPPPVEASIAHHLHPNRRTMPAASGVTLPTKADRITASVLQRIYKCAGRAACSLNAVTLLSAYQARILEDLGKQIDVDSPDPKLWEEICVVQDLLLRSARGAVQATGRTMGLAVAGERALWLNLSGLGDTQRADILDAPYDPTKGLFGPALTRMREMSTLRKQEDEAFNLCLPRKPAPRPQSSHQAFAPHTRGRQPAGRGQRHPPGAQGGQRSRGPSPAQWPKPSFAAAAAKTRHQPQQGGKNTPRA